MMCGLLAPTSGRAEVMGIDLRRSPARARERLGYMAQKFSLYGKLTVRQNLEFFSGVYGLSRTRQRQAVDSMIESFHLKQFLGVTTDDLSLGYKQRLALACAAMHEPDILFLDEPTSGVDPLTRREFWNHINGVVEKGVTVMVTTHFMDEAEYCDRIGLIHRGDLIAVGTPRELKTTLMREDVIEIICERPQDAMAEIGGVESVKEVALFGKGLHAVAADGDAAAAAIRQRLEARVYRIDRIEAITPSLEDVFVSLVEARDRAQESAKEVAA
jgi:ABC-2 type transport system ATP-binding protein